MNRRDFLKFLGLSAAGVLLPGAAEAIAVFVSGSKHSVLAASMRIACFHDGLPVIWPDGKACEALPDGCTLQLCGSIKAGENDVAAWVVNA